MNTITRSAVPEAANVAAPKLLILGHGSSAGRRLHAMRLKEALIERLNSCVEGPIYLAVELAIEELCARLESNDSMTIVRAADRG